MAEISHNTAVNGNLIPKGTHDDTKPTLLLVLSSVRGSDNTPEWQRTLSKFNILYYDCKTVDEFCSRLQPGGPYANINAIVRTGWLKAGDFAHHLMFRGRPIELYPPSLQFVGCSGHGYDAADIEAISQRGIAYANTPDTCTEAVANTALHLVLNVYRYFTLAEHYTRSDRWLDSREIGPVAVDPCGQVLGIVGLGDIGMAIARKAAYALDMKIHYHNRKPRPVLEAKLPNGATYHDSVESLVRAADCICLACPLTEETRHMISAPLLAQIKDKKIRIVNIARGGLIDEDALLEAMYAGQVVGLGLDVHANEPGINPGLRDNYRTTVLPHIGVASQTTWSKFDEVNLNNLEEFFFGDKGKVTLVNRASIPA
ncbi:Uu.00g079140.m01.CDS01 [Anthostomella pinea]|uniref:Uu.00g079140.m01.CDS01 n=1 Tax=Anthostomella pinea TaxID=933095 RepID=A0AAI8VFD0_9PEZI|nr:Uu.00g079140.m01.CDS01 [Anthostomella pinea]